jgi:hypothetical protein
VIAGRGRRFLCCDCPRLISGSAEEDATPRGVRGCWAQWASRAGHFYSAAGYMYSAAGHVRSWTTADSGLSTLRARVSRPKLRRGAHVCGVEKNRMCAFCGVHMYINQFVRLCASSVGNSWYY